MSAVAVPVSLQAVWQALEAVPDPEIPVVSIRELGILRDVVQEPNGSFTVHITPTYSGCPAVGQIEDDIVKTLLDIGVTAKVVRQLTSEQMAGLDRSAEHYVENARRFRSGLKKIG